MGGERKQRRLHSPLQEVDDGTEFIRQLEFDMEPQTPINAPTAPLTLEAIGQLLKVELQPVAASVKNLERQMAELNVSVDDRLQSITTRMDVTDSRVSELERMAQDKRSPRSDDSWVTQFTTLQQEIQQLKLKFGDTATAIDTERAHTCTVLVGGLSSLASADVAKQWIRDKLWSVYGPVCNDIYVKGDFRGIVFMKFVSEGERDEALRLMRAAKYKEGGKEVWVKPDKPLGVRTLRSLVFGTKFNLSEYYDKSTIWADVDEAKNQAELWLGEEKVFAASVSEKKLQISYEPTWRDWLHDEGFPEFKQMVATLNHKLSKSGSPATGAAKGSGKSKGGKAKGLAGRR